MTNRRLLSIFGAALLASAAPVVSGAGQPGAAQSSSASTAAKKKKHVSSKYKKNSKVKAQAAPTPDRIKEIQTALQKDGSYEGEPTGKWDAATADAMRKYQDKNGISPTGKIDAVSLNKLGLGSETAGKGAPVPAASSSIAPVGPPTKQ
ncbi:MAG TPA: peptidoglycan-binding domain-containing protein [Candidatus Acidoferrales bacterium]|jgi:peptidoglycan hydrolase-like protein with peptidoglycan-binding domain|nr:peptidoglycan-binding domain-containing protein [Candidatus Acidoferrales bacterium]